MGLASADFNGDGILDLVTETELLNQLVTFSIYPGVGDGTFSSRIDTSPNSTNATTIAIGDFNNDGKMDVAGTSYVMLGNGDGTLQPPLNYTGVGRGQPLAADINGDGNLDIIGLTANGDSVAVFLGNGDGSFQPEIDTGTGITGSTLTVADLNGDNKLDVSAGGALGSVSTVSTLSGNNDGTFQAASLQPLSAGTLLPGDFNGDGAVDLISVSGSSNVAVLLQGQFSAAVVSPTSLAFGPQTPGASSSAKQVTLKNTGTAAMTVSSIGINGSDTAEFTQTNTCGPSVAIGASCQINVIFTPTVVANGNAVLQINDNAPGKPHDVSISGTVSDFAVEPNSDTNQTVTAGQAANYSVNVESGNQFDGTVTLSCSGAPPDASCAVTPGSVSLTPEVGLVTANVAVVTKTGSGGFTESISGPPGWWIVGLGSTGILSLALLLMRRDGRWSPRWRYAAGLGCVIVTAFWIGCGGGSSKSGGRTPVGTYLMSVTGTYTARGVTVKHSTQFTLVVK